MSHMPIRCLPTSAHRQCNRPRTGWPANTFSRLGGSGNGHISTLTKHCIEVCNWAELVENDHGEDSRNQAVPKTVKVHGPVGFARSHTNQIHHSRSNCKTLQFKCGHML